MPRKRPHSPDDELRPPTVAEIIEQSPRVLETDGDLLGLAVAIGCLCRELDERDLDAYLAEDPDEDDDELFLWPEPDGPVH